MSVKRSNNAIWRIQVADDETPQGRLDAIIEAYENEASDEAFGKRPLTAVSLKQAISGVKLDLYVRSSFSKGLLPFIEEHLEHPEDAPKFHINGADACLFIATETSLYVVTSGGGYHVIADSVDYSFPFDMAKRLISNNFSAADVRDMTGSRSSRSETFRRNYSIDKSEAMDTIWKRLVGRLDAERLPEGSILRGLINPDRPPAVEIKSAFVLRQKLSLLGVCELVKQLEILPDPTEDHLKELAFLDNLYPIRGDKELTDALCSAFMDSLRKALVADETPDMDVLDPYEIVTFKAGAEFKLGRTRLGDSAPDIDDILPILKIKLASFLGDDKLFYDRVSGMGLSYKVDPDDASKVVSRKLLEFLHGQVEFGGRTYFRIDKVWYRCFGDFLENLKRDFIEEVFSVDRPVLLNAEVDFLPWLSGSEENFNRKQAAEDDFYFGDEIFAKVDRGKVELFDLLKVDVENKRLYVIHVKKDFAAKMRDACSQVTVCADIISKDINNGKPVLKKYYAEEWSNESLNSGVDEEKFLSWFDYELFYVVLCSTTREFVAEDFEKGRLTSHIARREILATKNEMKRSGQNFRLAHTRYGQKAAG